MRKLISFFLMIALLLSLSVTAFAAEEPEVSFDPNVTITESDDVITVVISTENNTYLAANEPVLSVPCTYDAAKVTFGELEIDSELDTTNDLISFKVAIGGIYTITKTSDTVNAESGGSAPGHSGGGTTPPSSPTVSTETTKNEDGSTTTTETKQDGTTVETTTNTDGSSTKTETKTEVKEVAGTTTTTTTSKVESKDAEGNKTTVESTEKVVETKDATTTTTETTTKTEDKTETVKTEEKVVTNEDGTKTTTTTTETATKLDNGSTGTTKTDETGKTEAAVKVSSQALTEAAKAEEPVALAMPALEVSTEDETAAIVTVTLPYGTKSATVAIPVAEGTGAGTVAVIVNADGTETILTESVVTENGLVATVPAGATVKVMDNSSTFSDVADNDWEKDAVDFTSARKIMNGTGEAFSPDMVTSRAMVWTMLARLEGVDTTPVAGEDWWTAGQKWAMENGISDGTNANGEITREQLAVMLHRFMGSPASDHELDKFHDHGETSDWAVEAKEWAVGTGVLNGKGNADGTLSLDPQGDASRAEVAQMFMNFIVNHF